MTLAKKCHFFCVPLRLQFSMLARRLFVLPTLVQQFYETYHNADEKLSPLVRAEVQIVLFMAPADFNLWEEEEV